MPKKKNKNKKKTFTPAKPSTPAVEDPRISAINRTEFSNRAVPTPLDHEGIPFMTATQVAPYYGIRSDWNAKRIAWDRDIPQYKEVSKPDVSGQQRGRVYFSMSQIADHLGSMLTERPDLKNNHNDLVGLLSAARAQRKVSDPNGEFHLKNQPHPANALIANNLAHFPGGRIQDIETPMAPNKEDMNVGFGSNTDRPLRNNRGSIVGTDSTDETHAKRAAEFFESAQRGRKYTPPEPK